MYQPFTLFLALRYGRARHGQGFTRFIQRVSLVGIVLGVAALIIVGSVMNGFEDQLKQRILSVVPQLEVHHAQGKGVTEWQQLAASLPAVAGQQAVVAEVTTAGVLQSAGQLRAVSVQGVFPEHADAEVQLAPLRQHLRAGQIDLTEGEFHVVLGYSLAQQLDVWPGQQIRLIAAGGGVYTPLGLLPAQRLVRVRAVVQLQSEADQHLVVMHGADLGRILRMAPGQVSGLRYYFADPFQALPAVTTLQQAVEPPLTVTSWRQQYGHLFDAVRMEKHMVSLMLSLIVAVAAFNIVSSLMMVVQDKRADVAILQTMGLSPARVRRVVVLQGLATGFIGSVMGLVLGLLVSVFVNPILGLLGVDLSFAGPQGLPVLIEPMQVMTIVFVALALTFLATLFPAWQASRVLPAHALRYE